MRPNHLLQRTLSNSFFALRHGQSLANIAKIISSDPTISTIEHGLSDLGKRQAQSAGEAFANEFASKEDDCEGVAVFSSDFTRARETAEIFAEELKKKKIPLYNDKVQLETRLRERYFGKLNGGPDTRYQEVWDVDVKDANHNDFGVESANSVLERTSKLICELDDVLNHSGKKYKCVVVAHGDVLQILQTGFLKHIDASKHRSLEHLETATIRELNLTSA
jgi:probable phosphoglycerate mutase